MGHPLFNCYDDTSAGRSKNLIIHIIPFDIPKEKNIVPHNGTFCFRGPGIVDEGARIEDRFLGGSTWTAISTPR
jgi:hypothetical protein